MIRLNKENVPQILIGVVVEASTHKKTAYSMVGGPVRFLFRFLIDFSPQIKLIN